MTKIEIAGRLTEILKSGNIAPKKVDVFGLNFIVTCYCDKSARRVKALMVKVARNVRMAESVDYVGDTMNSGHPRVVKVCRVGGAF